MSGESCGVEGHHRLLVRWFDADRYARARRADDHGVVVVRLGFDGDVGCEPITFERVDDHGECGTVIARAVVALTDAFDDVRRNALHLAAVTVGREASGLE